jgi:hypothetical protein
MSGHVEEVLRWIDRGLSVQNTTVQPWLIDLSDPDFALADLAAAEARLESFGLWHGHNERLTKRGQAFAPTGSDALALLSLGVKPQHQPETTKGGEQ